MKTSIKRFLTLVLVCVLVAGNLNLTAFAMGGNSSPVQGDDIHHNMRLNEWYDIDLSQHFSDPEGDALTYYVSDDNKNWTAINGSTYRFYPAGDRGQRAYFKAKDANGESGVLTLWAAVEEAPSEVTVTLSMTQGIGAFYTSPEGEIMFPVELTVPYFDLANYGLEHYYYNPRCYSTHKDTDTEHDNNQIAGTKETADGIVTTMHVFIYATEVLYMGYNEADAGKGYSYEDSSFAETISWTGGVGSSFMNLWDHGTNLNYYINWSFPLGAPGWGSTSDQQALYGGEDISIHMIQKSSATGSNFTFFTVDGKCDPASQVDEVTVAKGEKITLTAVQSQDNWQGAVTAFAPYGNMDVVWVEEYNGVGNLSEWYKTSFGGNDVMKTDANGQFVIDTTDLELGTYYIAVMGYENRDNMTQLGPAVIKLTVEPGEVKGDMDGNGIINVTDVNMLIDAYREKTYVAIGDMNVDGKIDVTDVNELIDAYRKKS